MPFSEDCSPDMTRRQILYLTVGAAGIVSMPDEASAVSKTSHSLNLLAEDYFQALVDANPFWASQLGMASRSQAARVEIEISPASRAKASRLHKRMLGQLKGITRAKLSDSDATTYDLIEWLANDQIAILGRQDHLLPLDQLALRPPFQLAAPFENGLSTFSTADDFELHLLRLRALPAWCAQAETNFSEGAKAGIRHPQVIVERLLTMLRALVPAQIEASPYLAPLNLSTAQQRPETVAHLRRAYLKVVDGEVNPALLRLVQTLQSIGGRSSDGWSALPGGKDWYRVWVRSHTGTNLSPQAIHELGLQEVQRLRSRMTEVQQQYGFAGSLDEFLQWHDKRKETRPFMTEGDVLGAYGRLNDRIVSQLPRLFKHAPKSKLEIRPEPVLTRDTASDHYEPSSVDGSRPGVFYAVIPDGAAYSAAPMASLFLHEGQPGHHYQMALAQESNLPKLQRFYYHMAFGEGWALYAETLGYPLGLYEDPTAHLGHLSMAMMRAVRLVVDTGIHELGWSRERATSYFKRQTGFSDTNTRIQIERYMVSPGQALSYATGRLSIEKMRDDAKSRLGPRFELADFHEQVLNSGALPLSVLQSKIRQWIDAKVRT
jgi:uncharacterized protein (DUF885 family)